MAFFKTELNNEISFRFAEKGQQIHLPNVMKINFNTTDYV